ncbi:MAG: ABC transporter permease [Candidatus Odinarchaeota archaeon]
MKIIHLLTFAAKNAFRKKGVAFLAITGIAIGLTLQITLNSYSNGMVASLDEMSNELVGSFEVREEGLPNTFLSQIPSNVTELLETSQLNGNIIGISPELHLPGTATSNYSNFLSTSFFGTSKSIKIVGIDLEAFLTVSNDIDDLTEGSSYFKDGKDEVIIPYKLYRENESLFSIGETIELMINQTYTYQLTISGITAKEDSAEMIERRRDLITTSFDVYTSIETTRNIMEVILSDMTSIDMHFVKKGLDYTRLNNESYSTLAIKTDLTETASADEFASELENFLDELYESDYKVISMSTAVDTLDDVQASMTLFIDIISYIAIIAGGMGIIIAQLVGVESRIKEFAILKATGWNNRHLVLDVVTESIVLGLMGSIAGIILSNVLMLALGGMMSAGSLSIVSGAAISEAIFVALVIGLIGGLYPGIKASSVRPMEVLRGN